jgi:hypothetical protein
MGLVDPHGMLTLGTDKRVYLIDFPDQFSLRSMQVMPLIFRRGDKVREGQTGDYYRKHG